MTITHDLQGLHHNSEGESNWACQGTGAEPTHKLDFPTSISEGQFSCSLFIENRYLIKKKKKQISSFSDRRYKTQVTDGSMLEKTI